MIIHSGASEVTDQEPSGLLNLPEKRVRISNLSTFGNT